MEYLRKKTNPLYLVLALHLYFRFVFLILGGVTKLLIIACSHSRIHTHNHSACIPALCHHHLRSILIIILFPQGIFVTTRSSITLLCHLLSLYFPNDNLIITIIFVNFGNSLLFLKVIIPEECKREPKRFQIFLVVNVMELSSIYIAVTLTLLIWCWNWWSTKRANGHHKDHLDGQLKLGAPSSLYNIRPLTRHYCILQWCATRFRSS